MSDGTHARALRYAAKLVGGVPALAKRLGVLPVTVDGWIAGIEGVPEVQFLRTVDILLEHNGRPR